MIRIEVLGETGRASFVAPLLAVALLLFTVGVVLPYTLFINNAEEFSITLGKLLLVAIPALVLSLAAATLLIRFLPPLRNPRVVATVFAVAVLAWIQGTLIVWQYGPLDGRTIDWEAYRTNGWIDAGVWLAVLGLAIWQARRVVQVVTFVSSILIALQAFGLLFIEASTAQKSIAGTIKSYSIDSQPKFSLSSGRNVFLIVLDEVQSDVFSDIVETDQSYRQMFDGFTYFPDAVAGANFTELAIPALLTGRLYDNSVPKSEFLADAFLQNSVFAMLKRHGFRVDMYPWVGWGNETIYFDETIVDNLKSRQGPAAQEPRMLTEKEVKEIIHLADLALFRAVPHFVKPLIYNNQQWFLMGIVSRFVPDEVKAVVSTDNEFETTVFAEQAALALRADRDDDVFKYYHLKGAHKPLTVLPDLNVTSVPVPFSRETYILQIKASLRALERFFSSLKRLGVWENSFVLIVADHGSGETPEMYIDSTAGKRAKTIPGAPDSKRGFPKDKARGVPLVLVKRVHSSGPMQVSKAPVSILDVPATIVAELELPETPDGVSMFSIDNVNGRVRQYAAFDYSETRTSYVGPMTRYIIDGHSWDDESWWVENILLPPSAVEAAVH